MDKLMVIKCCNVVNECTSILIIGVQQSLDLLFSSPLKLDFKLFKQVLHQPLYILSAHGLKYILILYSFVSDVWGCFLFLVISEVALCCIDHCCRFLLAIAPI